MENINLVELVKLNISSVIDTYTGDKFYNNQMVIPVHNENLNYQRVILNRYFNNLLFNFRSKKDIPVHNITTFLINDGTTEDWLSLFNSYVLPFIKENNVFFLVD